MEHSKDWELKRLCTTLFFLPEHVESFRYSSSLLDRPGIHISNPKVPKGFHQGFLGLVAGGSLSGTHVNINPTWSKIPRSKLHGYVVSTSTPQWIMILNPFFVNIQKNSWQIDKTFYSVATYIPVRVPIAVKWVWVERPAPRFRIPPWTCQGVRQQYNLVIWPSTMNIRKYFV